MSSERRLGLRPEYVKVHRRREDSRPDCDRRLARRKANRVVVVAYVRGARVPET
jgi:hypothetical protein